MKCKIKNNSSLDLGSMLPLLKSFLPFAQERMGFSHPPSLEFLSDSENSSLPLGKTAHYSPSDSKICIFVDKRHPKDIMRSLSHELVHHKQNCNGKFNSDMDMGEGYAQSNAHLREMEKEAYLEGNMMMRDWEDKYKKVLQETIYYETFKGDTKMSIIETKRTRFNNLLMERWGYKAPEQEELTLQESELDEAHCGGVHEDEEEELEEGEKKPFPDLTGDGKVTQADILKGRGVGVGEKDEKELDEGAIEDAERDAQQAINKAKSEIASASSPPPVQNTDNMGADMTDPMEEDALRKKIREVLRNSFNAKS
tara:strand:- start:164 stop:1096 length:933 start_codon:yes stop_codon:yes gene_type:complete